jgi:hypothetical protein
MMRLPGWVVDDVTSVKQEVAEWRGLSQAALWDLAKRCSRDAMWAIRASGRAEQILAHEDPLPESTMRALARLRREAGWPRGR